MKKAFERYMVWVKKRDAWAGRNGRWLIPVFVLITLMNAVTSIVHGLAGALATAYIYYQHRVYRDKIKHQVH